MFVAKPSKPERAPLGAQCSTPTEPDGTIDNFYKHLAPIEPNDSPTIGDQHFAPRNLR